MRMILLALCGVLIGSAAVAGEAVQVRGDYLEARTADVFTGPCFSNSEVFIVGDRAVMAWKVTEGSWEGVDLSGLAVAAAVRGTSTFSEDRPELASSVLIVDEKADPQQRQALIAMARRLAGARLENVVDVVVSPIDLSIDEDCHMEPHGPAHKQHLMPMAPPARFAAADLAEIATRPLDANDCICGNEVIAYEPLSEGVEVQPAYTVGHSFQGAGLKSTWAAPNARSSFVGRFAY
ncbi:DUF1326 domain-containing protein [Tautonia sociabilis]|uniref:DUF1326 domain-containing protein n=1 Tax=Tautonia sociabilis TaxID=2080755 RepID=A0A432MQB7_9BACT|nr:DUF1326 domain-containing protein [Tautonia sociabilis]RUL89256.1 DUF1326 domain-containing protein [Tautonia sociabilis]